jgi:hypothetical protein
MANCIARAKAKLKSQVTCIAFTVVIEINNRIDRIQAITSEVSASIYATGHVPRIPMTNGLQAQIIFQS